MLCCIIGAVGQASNPTEETVTIYPMIRSITRAVPALTLAAVLGACTTQTGPASSRDLSLADNERLAEEGVAAYLREHYTKSEHRVPMRDGATLFTSVYSPKDTSERYPILLLRTPYTVAPYGADEFPSRFRPNIEFAEAGYHFVFQDVRGKFMSEGDFVNMRPHNPDKQSDQDVDESTDTYDTIQWLMENVDNHNSRVGQWGISYPGFYTSAGMPDAHPALKASSPQAPIADWYFDDFYHNGAFFLPHFFNFFYTFGREREGLTTEWPERIDHGTPDGYHFFLELGSLKNVNEKYYKNEIPFWNEVIQHPTRDEYWQARDILPHLQRVPPAVMTVGGWFDAEDLYGPLATYRAVEQQNPDVENLLVMGPWSHGGWLRGSGERLGDAQFSPGVSNYFQNHVMLPFFEHHLRGGPEHHLPEALVYETGANQWRHFSSWPPAAAEESILYLRDGWTLSLDSPADPGRANDEYLSDPNRPVPYTTDITTGMTRPYMTDDQRFNARRTDVLSYTTPVLDRDVTMAGPLVAELWVSTTMDDADFVVKLVDIFPPDAEDHDELDDGMRTGNYHMLVRSEAIRGRYRNSFENPEPFTRDTPTLVRLPLQDVMHTFKKGHKIQIQIQSTWFPIMDRNPQKWVENIFFAEDDDFTAATHRVFRSSEYPSRIVFGSLGTGAALIGQSGESGSDSE